MNIIDINQRIGSVERQLMNAVHPNNVNALKIEFAKLYGNLQKRRKTISKKNYNDKKKRITAIESRLRSLNLKHIMKSKRRGGIKGLYNRVRKIDHESIRQYRMAEAVKTYYNNILQRLDRLVAKHFQSVHPTHFGNDLDKYNWHKKNPGYQVHIKIGSSFDKQSFNNEFAKIEHSFKRVRNTYTPIKKNDERKDIQELKAKIRQKLANVKSLANGWNSLAVTKKNTLIKKGLAIRSRFMRNGLSPNYSYGVRPYTPSSAPYMPNIRYKKRFPAYLNGLKIT